MQNETILQILAEPNLVTTNGKEAYFLVGGEFPVPVRAGRRHRRRGHRSVQASIGIKLMFTPDITANGTIKMHLYQEVSTLDLANGVTLNGFTIPALSTRTRRNRRGAGRRPELRGGRPGQQPGDSTAFPRFPSWQLPFWERCSSPRTRR